MKKILSNILLASAAAALVLTSCAKGALDTEPTSQVAESNIFSSTDNALMAINGIHRLMHEGGSSGTTTGYYGQGGYTTFCLHLAWMSDDVVWTYENVMYKFSAQWTHHWNLTHNYNDLNYYWKFFYRVINNANKVLYYIDDKEKCPGDDSSRNFVKGQALAYRAFALFQLTQTWGERYYPEKAGHNDQLGVVIRTEPSMESNVARSTVEQCYDQIVKDINAAIECLQNTSETKKNKSHIDVWVAKGMKARILLTMGKWAEAAAVAEDVVKNSGAALQADTYTCGPFNNQMSDMSNTEWLWGQAHSDDATQHGALRAWHNFISNNSASYNRNSPRAINSLLFKTIPDTDVRKNNWVENPFTRKKGNVKDNGANDGITLWVPTGSARICPYMSQKWLIDDAGVQNTYFDVPYMRLPEMMMIAAEGYAKSNQPAKAQQLVYDLGHFRDPAFTMPTETGDALVEKIMWQRRVELWAEAGLRWLDLKRLNVACDRGPKPRDGYNQGGTANGWGTSMKKMPTNLDPLASNYNMYGEQFPGEAARYIPANSLKWQWLIPYNEMDSNELMVQNPTE